MLGVGAATAAAAAFVGVVGFLSAPAVGAGAGAGAGAFCFARITTSPLRGLPCSTVCANSAAMTVRERNFSIAHFTRQFFEVGPTVAATQDCKKRRIKLNRRQKVLIGPFVEIFQLVDPIWRFSRAIASLANIHVVRRLVFQRSSYFVSFPAREATETYNVGFLNINQLV